MTEIESECFLGLGRAGYNRNNKNDRNDICNTLSKVLEDAERLANQKEYLLAFSMITQVVINNAKLASKGDNSSGCISDVQEYAEELMERICNSE